MKTSRIVAAASALLVASGLAAVMTAAAAPSSSAAPVGDQLSAVATPLVSQEADGYQGKWAVQSGTLVESFEKDGVVISTGMTSLRDGLAADEVTSFGYVAGFGDPDTGDQHAQLSGQAGTAVTAVRVVSASGTTTSATLVDGIWAAVWTAGDSVDEYGAATLQVDTATGTNTVSTDDVDVIAAEQRAADRG